MICWIRRSLMQQNIEAVSEAFKLAFRHHPAGVAILTADSGEGPVALTVSSLISVSANPPMVAFSLSEASSNARAILQAETLVVHFVRRKDMQLARLCATSGTERFNANVKWDRLATGEPFYMEIEPRFRAAVRGRLAVPGASVVTAELLDVFGHATEQLEKEALVYTNRTWHGLRPVTDPVAAPIQLWPDDSAIF
jgi:flavin reductase (DIM6/NTAB) family NADH-FMN oxidoreductase RutF